MESKTVTTIQWQNNRECVHEFQRTPSLWEIKDALTVMALVIDRIHATYWPSPDSNVVEVSGEELSALVVDELGTACSNNIIGQSLVIVDRENNAVKFGGKSPRDRVCERMWGVTLTLPNWIKLR